MTRFIKSRSRMVAFLAVLVAGVACAGTAIAVSGKAPSAAGKATQSSGGKQYVTKSVDSVSNGVQYTAKCPKHTHLVGGGAGADSGSGDLNESRPFDGADDNHAPDDGWAAYFNDVPSSGARVYAICE